MSVVEILEYEHGIILEACALTSQIVCSRSSNRKHTVDKLKSLTGFFRSFGDHCHCQKEERVLFAHLLKHRMALFYGPITNLMAEHQKQRMLLERVEALVDSADLDNTQGAIGGILTDYVNLTQ